MTQPSLSQLVPPTLALLGAGALLFSLSGSPADLAADNVGGTEDDGGPAGYPDADEDGLSDIQEIVMGTDPLLSDTDGDGYGDLEEFARKSDPSDASDVPADTPINVGLLARVEEDVLYIGTALYLRHDETAGYKIQIGIMVGGQLLQLPSQVFLYGSSLSQVEAKDPADRIVLLDTPYPTLPIHELGQISFWSKVTPSALGEQPEIDIVDIVSDPGGLELLQLEFVGPGESIYRPISAEPPASSWSPGQICVQRSMNVGNVGPVSEHLVESATCEAADAYCSPSCPELAGTSFQVVDPLVLLGG